MARCGPASSASIRLFVLFFFFFSFSQQILRASPLSAELNGPVRIVASTTFTSFYHFDVSSPYSVPSMPFYAYSTFILCASLQPLQDPLVISFTWKFCARFDGSRSALTLRPVLRSHFPLRRRSLPFLLSFYVSLVWRADDVESVVSTRTSVILAPDSVLLSGNSESARLVSATNQRCKMPSPRARRAESQQPEKNRQIDFQLGPSSAVFSLHFDLCTLPSLSRLQVSLLVPFIRSII